MPNGEALIDVGGAIKYFLAEKKMTQGDLYRATGLERSYISRLVNNEFMYPRRETIEKIVKALDVSMDDFINRACKIVCDELRE